MKKKTKKNTMTDWDWTTLVAAWRYYEHRDTIESYMFPHKIVTRFFTGKYDNGSCKLIAQKFVEIDHCNGPDGNISGLARKGLFEESNRMAWRLLYFYLFARLYGFSTANVTLDGKSHCVEVFRADGNWYSREGYERFGAHVSPYKDGEIEIQSIKMEGADK